MGLVVLPRDLTNGTNADADHVMENLEAITAQVNGNLGAANIADGGVGTAEIANLGVTAGKLAVAAALANLLDGTVPAAKLVADSITAAQIAAGAVGASEIATDAVGSDEIYMDYAYSAGAGSVYTAAFAPLVTIGGLGAGGVYLILASAAISGSDPGALAEGRLNIDGGAALPYVFRYFGNPVGGPVTPTGSQMGFYISAINASVALEARGVGGGVSFDKASSYLGILRIR